MDKDVICKLHLFGTSQPVLGPLAWQLEKSLST